MEEGEERKKVLLTWELEKQEVLSQTNVSQGCLWARGTGTSCQVLLDGKAETIAEYSILILSDTRTGFHLYVYVWKYAHFVSQLWISKICKVGKQGKDWNTAQEEIYRQSQAQSVFFFQITHSNSYCLVGSNVLNDLIISLSKENNLENLIEPRTELN